MTPVSMMSFRTLPRDLFLQMAITATRAANTVLAACATNTVTRHMPAQTVAMLGGGPDLCQSVVRAQMTWRK